MSEQNGHGKKMASGKNLWLAAACQILKGGAIAAAAALLTLLLCALLISIGMIGEPVMDRAVLAVCVLSGLIGGLTVVRKSGRNAVPVGLGTGAVLFLLLLAAGFLSFPSASLSNGGGQLLLSCCVGGTMAGILGRRTKKKHKR